MARDKAVSIIGCLDYRAYLKEVYQHLKATMPQFSSRYFAKKAGLSSPSFFKMVVDGERNLTPMMTERFITALGLKGPEADYFRLLVRYNQATMDAQRNRYLADLRRIMERRKANALSLAQYDYLSRWFAPAIREMIPCLGFSPKPAEIARKLFNQITPDEARAAVDLLYKLGLIALKGGRLVQSTPHIRTDDSIVHLAMKNYHRQMLSQASKSIDRQQPEERELRALTIGVDPDKIPEAKRRIQVFIDEMRGLLQSTDPRQVYQLGVQFFGMTERFPDQDEEEPST